METMVSYAYFLLLIAFDPRLIQNSTPPTVLLSLVEMSFLTLNHYWGVSLGVDSLLGMLFSACGSSGSP